MQDQMGKGGTLGLLQVRACADAHGRTLLRRVLTWLRARLRFQGALMGEPVAPPPKKKALEGGAAGGGGGGGSSKKKH